MIRDDDECGARGKTRLFDRQDDSRHLPIQVRHRRCGRERARPVAVLHGIERQQMEHHQVRPVLADDVRRRGRPDVIAKHDVLRREVLHRLLRHEPGANHLARDCALRVGTLAGTPT